MAPPHHAFGNAGASDALIGVDNQRVLIGAGQAEEHGQSVAARIWLARVDPQGFTDVWDGFLYFHGNIFSSA